MKLSTAQNIVKKMEAEGCEASVYEDYSGRGMYGRNTAGVNVGQYDHGHKLVKRFRCDSLGKGYIYY